MMRKILLGLLGLMAVGVMGAGEYLTWTNNKGEYGTMSFTSANDTVQRMSITPSHAINSMKFADTFAVYKAGVLDTVEFHWTAPVSGNSVAMVCDSMVKYGNADTGVANYLTFLDSTTKYAVYSDDAGQPFIWLAGDTCHDAAGDTSTTVANGTSWSKDTGVVYIGSTQGYDGLDCFAIINPGLSATQGIGLADSGWLWLYTFREAPSDRKLLDSAVAAALPCTLDFRIPQATGDTLFRGFLQLKWQVADSATDTTFDLAFPLHWNITVR